MHPKWNRPNGLIEISLMAFLCKQSDISWWESSVTYGISGYSEKAGRGHLFISGQQRPAPVGPEDGNLPAESGAAVQFGRNLKLIHNLLTRNDKLRLDAAEAVNGSPRYLFKT